MDFTFFENTRTIRSIEEVCICTDRGEAWQTKALHLNSKSNQKQAHHSKMSIQNRQNLDIDFIFACFNIIICTTGDCSWTQVIKIINQKKNVFFRFIWSLPSYTLLRKTCILCILSLKHSTFLEQIKSIHIIIYETDYAYLNLRKKLFVITFQISVE